MVRIAQDVSDRLMENDHQQGEECAGNEERKVRRFIHRMRIKFIAVGETEESGLHTIGKKNQQQGRPSIDVRYDTVFGRAC